MAWLAPVGIHRGCVSILSKLLSRSYCVLRSRRAGGVLGRATLSLMLWTLWLPALSSRRLRHGRWRKGSWVNREL